MSWASAFVFSIAIVTFGLIICVGLLCAEFGRFWRMK
jgi:hypothetical protein